MSRETGARHDVEASRVNGISSVQRELGATRAPVRSGRSLRITYVGPAAGTSLQRAQALERLGHTVTFIDPWIWLGHSKWMSRWLFHTGGIGVEQYLRGRLLSGIERSEPDVIWVNDCAFLGARTVRQFRYFEVPLVNYSADNPYGAGVRTKWW